MSNVINETGNIYGRLTVVKRADNTKDGRALWICRCECGKKVTVIGKSLREKVTQSCGCLVKTHGHTIGRQATPTFQSWRGMRRRCNGKAGEKSKKYYHDKGISYCKQWESFEIFLADMGEKPKGLTLGRIDGDSDYSPENCRWETMVQQNNNRDFNVVITFDRKNQTIAQWSRDIGIKYTTLYRRINDYGWSISKALTTPVKKR